MSCQGFRRLFIEEDFNCLGVRDGQFRINAKYVAMGVERQQRRVLTRDYECEFLFFKKPDDGAYPLAAIANIGR